MRSGSRSSRVGAGVNLPAPCIDAHLVQITLGAPAQQFTRKHRVCKATSDVARAAIHDAQRDAATACALERSNNFQDAVPFSSAKIDRHASIFRNDVVECADMSGSQLANGPFGNNQMLVAEPTTGEMKRFLVGPVGCEVTGITATPDFRTLFVNIQHPGEGSTASNLLSTWPDGPGRRPRSATVVVTREDGKRLM